MLARTIALIRTEIAKTRDTPLPDEIDATTTWREIQCDPLDVLCITHAAEDEFDVRFPVEVEDCDTVGALAEMIAGLLPEED
jgi:acyl carrier protein